MDPINVASPSITIVLAWAIRARSSIQIGTPAAASSSISLPRPHGVFLSAISRTSDTAFLGTDQRPDNAGADCGFSCQAVVIGFAHSVRP
jgi:hypothetical protein